MIQIFQYQNSPIQFEVIDGQVMANATVMAKALNKDMSSIFSTKTWIEYEAAVKEELEDNSVDLRRSKPGQPANGGGTWIHQELVLEFSRRLNTKFSLWCNRIIAELLRTGAVSLKPKSAAEQLLENALVMVEHERRISSLESKVDVLLEIKADATKQIEYLPLSSEALPEETEKVQVIRLVDNYCEQTGISHHDTWRKLYADLNYKYRIKIRSHMKLRGEKSHLDVAYRLGHCGKLKAIISVMINDFSRMAS